MPFSDDAGHKIRARQLIEAFVRTFDVTVAGFVEPDGDAQPRGSMNCDVLAEPAAIRIRRQPARLASVVLRSLVRGEPYSLSKFENDALLRRLRALREAAPPDVVVANLAMTRYLDLFPTAVKIIDSHNIEATLWHDFVRATRSPARVLVRREARLLKDLERAAWTEADGVIAICAEDAKLIAADAPSSHVVIVPPALERKARAGRGVARRADVGLLGVWSWAPNEHALEVFAQQMAPRLREAGVSIRVTGPGMATNMRRRLEALEVQVTGAVQHVEDFYGEIDQVAAPYFQGGGVRLKVLEAIAFGVPLVGTPLAFRGILGVDDAAAEVCADVDAMVGRLLQNREGIAAAKARAQRLRANVLNLHDSSRIALALDAALAGWSKA